MASFGLSEAEARAVAAEFGVALDQVRRDHLISLILAALSSGGIDVTFFGGTALARTHLPDGRLSEDIDLITAGRRGDVARRLSRVVNRALRPVYGRPSWIPGLDEVPDTDPSALRTVDGLVVRVQRLRDTGYPPWPTEVREMEQRYSDVPPARLRVPTRDAFVAWKTVAWYERARRPRSLRPVVSRQARCHDESCLAVVPPAWPDWCGTGGVDVLHAAESGTVAAAARWSDASGRSTG